MTGADMLGADFVFPPPFSSLHSRGTPFIGHN
jgi:hypothetical protein